MYAYCLPFTIPQDLLLARLERLGVLAADPHGIRLVDAGGAGQGPLGQRADRGETTQDGQGLLTLADALAERLVAVGHRLDGVVPVASQHTPLEATDDLLGPTDRPDVVRRD